MSTRAQRVMLTEDPSKPAPPVLPPLFPTLDADPEARPAYEEGDVVVIDARSQSYTPHVIGEPPPPPRADDPTVTITREVWREGPSPGAPGKSTRTLVAHRGMRMLRSAAIKAGIPEGYYAETSPLGTSETK